MASSISPASTVKTRFLIISDTHNAQLQESNSHYAFRKPLPKADVLLHCGDLTMSGKLEEYDRTLNLLGSIDAELKLVIAGNHDISLDELYYARRGMFMHRNSHDPDMPAKAISKWKGEEAKAAGVTYLDEGIYNFTLNNGANFNIFASPYQPEFCDWAFPYYRNQDRYNPVHLTTPGASCIVQNPIPNFPNVDVLMTHGPPLAVLDSTHRGEHVGCEHLRRAAARARPRLHAFGHIHEAWGAAKVSWSGAEETRGDPAKLASNNSYVQVKADLERQDPVFVDVSSDSSHPLKYGEETLMVNASIMNLRYRPMNAPWVVDIDLPLHM